MANKYKEFFHEIMGDERKKLKKHTKRVVELCDKLCKKLNDNGCSIDKDILISAAWIHDIGKLETTELHHFAIVLEKVLSDELIDKDISGIIEQHKGVFNPKSYPKECAILRLCDKIDKFHDEQYKEVKKKCEKTLDEIVKANCFEKSDIEILVEFYEKKKEKAKKTS